MMSAHVGVGKNLKSVAEQIRPSLSMNASYPKQPAAIRILITNRATNDGLLSEIKTVAEVPLNVKLNDYIVRLGYSSTNLAGFVIELFTKGKVCLDFEYFTERIELIDAADMLSGSQAMALLADFIAETERAKIDPDPDKPKSNFITQNIVIKQHKAN